MGKNETEESNTYLFTNFGYRSDRFGTYVNSPKSESCSFEKCESVMDVRDVHLFESNSFTDEEELTLISLETVSKHVLCNKYNRKLNTNKESLQQFVRCNHCNNNNRVKPSRSMYFLKIIFRKKDNKNVTLTLFNGNICSSSNVLTKIKAK